MDIVIVCHAWYHDMVGGAFRVATEFAERLAGRGHNVFYLCGTTDREPENPQHINGVQVWRYAYPRFSSPHPINMLGHIWQSYRLTRQVLRLHPQAIVNGHSPLQFFGAAFAARRCGAATVYSAHSPFVEELRANWDGNSLAVKHRSSLALAARLEAEILRRAHVVQCDSTYTLDHLQARYPKQLGNKGTVVPAWIDVASFSTSQGRAELRSRLGSPWQVGVPTFFTLRRLVKRMGLEQLLQAAHLARRQGFDFRLVVGGSGPLRSELEQMAADLQLDDTVSFLGRVPDDQVADCFAAADCFVLPTQALECFGLIILESYAAGTPVIGTPVGAIPETMGEFMSQWLSDGNDEHVIADAMARFLQGRLSYDAAALREYAAGFHVDVGVDRLWKLLLRVRGVSTG